MNLAIVGAATRGDSRFARGLALGGAVADGLHAAIAFVGVARVLASHPRWMQAMAVAAAVVILVYVALAARSRVPATASADIELPRRSASGAVTGLLLTLPNPAALGAWMAVAAAVWPTITAESALVVAAGVTVGSAGWFTLLARWAAALPRDGRLARILPRVALALLAGIAVVGVARAFA